MAADQRRTVCCGSWELSGLGRTGARERCRLHLRNEWLPQPSTLSKVSFSISSVAAVIEPQREKTCLQRFASGQSDQRLCYSLFGKYHI